MARPFRGESTQKVDGKGRVSIPASFRRVLAAGDPNCGDGDPAEMVIVYGDHRRKFLECYTIEAIAEVEARIAKMPRGSSARRYMEKMFTGLVWETSVDGTGRLVLPKKLRDKIGIGPDTDAFFIASGDRFQIWHPETYEAEEEGYEEEIDALLPEGEDPLVLLYDGPEAV
ncbi:MAG: division/cell wall cluster transcriptional repressor MraZ [Mangrovicoccus sp.]|nr:division/cell wall cluster transcriptional repressor MraZ [Mangrovicoccus sp.]